MLKKAPTNLPDTPGVYKMLDESGEIIYIGKAKNIKKRVKQYFKEGYSHSSRTRKLMEKVNSIETISVDTELESIILESGLIKEHQPKYNIIMKDDKSYVYIKITKEDFPKVQIVREIKKDGAKYFGPKTAQHKVKTTLKLLKKIFPFRHCNLAIKIADPESEVEQRRVKVTNKVIKYPCLDYYIKRCGAPCIGKINKEEYLQTIDKVEKFLKGNADEVISDLKNQMTVAALEKKYEKAAKIRDNIFKIEDILEKQKVASPNTENQDIINFCTIQNNSYFNLFQVRDGKLIGQENFTLKAEDLESTEQSEILSSFLVQYYQIATDIPQEIIIPNLEIDLSHIEDFINTQSERRVYILTPKIGTKHKLLEMSLKNAQIYADRSKPSWKKESELTIAATEELQKVIGLEKTPKRIECYDISHLGGTNTVASMVVFKNGAPAKKHYRKFNIKTVENGKPDDFKSMEEVITRRLNYITDKFTFKDLKFGKAKKSEDDLIQKQLEDAEIIIEDYKYSDFYCLRDEQTVLSFGKYTEINEKISLLKALCIINTQKTSELARKTLQELIRKTKSKRFYVFCRPEQTTFYNNFGFEYVKKINKDLEEEYQKAKKEIDEPICLVYDKIKQKTDLSFSEIPDLIIIDGGKGQLSSAHKVFLEKNIDIPHISLAKKQEEIFLPNESTSILLPRNNKALQLIQRARDEAHRFAITFQKSKREF